MAVLTTFILKANPSNSSIYPIADIGLEVGVGETLTFTFPDDAGWIDDIRKSEDAHAGITDDAHGANSSSLILNDGTSDIDQEDAIAFLMNFLNSTTPGGFTFIQMEEDGSPTDDVIDADAVAETASKFWLTSAERAAIIVNTAKVTNATHTGEVTGSTALTIADSAVITDRINDSAVTTVKVNDSAITPAKIADVPTVTLRGRTTAGTGVVENLTALQAASVVGVRSGWPLSDGFPVAPNTSLSSSWRAPIAGTLEMYVMREGDQPVTAGTYTLDLRNGGVTILSASVDLTSITPTAGVWVSISINVPAVVIGDDLSVHVISDNVDLTPAPAANVETGTLYMQIEVVA